MLCLCTTVMVHPEGKENEVVFFTLAVYLIFNLELSLISLKLKETETL